MSHSYPVQIFTFDRSVIWFNPLDFPTVETDGVLIARDGDLLTLYVDCATPELMVHISQVVRIETPHRLECAQINEDALQEYFTQEGKHLVKTY